MLTLRHFAAKPETVPATTACILPGLAEKGIALTQTEYFERYLAMDDKGCFETVLAASREHNVG